MTFPTIRQPAAPVAPVPVYSDPNPDPDTIRAVVVARLIRAHGVSFAMASTLASLAGFGPSDREGR